MTTYEPAAKRPSALLLEGIHARAQQCLTEAGWEVSCLDSALTEARLIEALQGYDALGIRSGTHVSDDVLAACPSLQMIGAFCIGTTQIDLDAASDRGVAVFNAPYSNSRSVVEMAIAQIIALTRRLPDVARSMRDGKWHKSAAGAHEVRGRRLGIVGYGNIGTQLSVLAEAMGMQVSYFDIVDRPPLGNARRCDSLAELLQTSEIVSLHVDGRPENRGIIGERELDQLPPGALLLNLSRGSVVDLEALGHHLDNGHLAGAAIDVFPEEPRSRASQFESHLRELPNVILTPHIAGSTEEAQEDIGEFVSSKLRDYYAWGETVTSVNLPALALGQPDAGLRVTHLHTNAPGLMAKINAVLAESAINVQAQQLSTRGHLGYAISDVNEWNGGAMTRLMRLPGTIRVRTPGALAPEPIALLRGA